MSADAQSPRRRKHQNSSSTGIDLAHTEGTEVLEPPRGEDDEASDLPTRRRTPEKANAERKSTRLELVESVFRMASLAAISASVVLAACQFYQDRVDDQKDRSVKLMTMWQSSETRDAYARIQKELETRISNAGTIGGQVTPKALSQIKFIIGQNMVEDLEKDAGDYMVFREDLDLIFNFYSEVHFCIDAGLCDELLLTAYFGDEAILFWEYFRGYAQVRRDSFYPDYGIALESFVTNLQSSNDKM